MIAETSEGQWKQLFLEVSTTGIDFVDVGCSGDLDARWTAISHLFNYIGFDPNAEESERLAALPHKYRRAKYLPYAISGEIGPMQFHITKSAYCSSLLLPNHSWLNRFSFADLFAEIDTLEVPSVTLDLLVESDGLRSDILKLDTQGLELPILESADSLVGDSFCIETETGFMPNYHGESVYAEVDAYLRHHGYRLFDLTSHPIGRANPLARHGRHQPLWCEALWLLDYIGIEQLPNAVTAIKSLAICWALGYFDYGYELAVHFLDNGVLEAEYYDWLRLPESWLAHEQLGLSRTARLLKMMPTVIQTRIINAAVQILKAT